MTRSATNYANVIRLPQSRRRLQSAIVLAIVLLLLSLLTAPECVAGVPAAKDAWIVNQVANATGAFTLVFTADAIKATSKRSGFVAIARAPTWRVCVYNPRRKLKYESSLLDFGKYGVIPAIVAQEPMDMGKAVPPKIANITICGLHCRAYETFHKGNTSGTTSLSSFGRTTKGLGNSQRLYFVTNDIAYTPERGKFLCGIYKHEIIGAIQTRQIETYASGPSQVELDTVSAKHQSVAVAEMQYPSTGYRFTKVPQEVAEDETERKGLEELFDGVSGFGDATGRSK